MGLCEIYGTFSVVAVKVIYCDEMMNENRQVGEVPCQATLSLFSTSCSGDLWENILILWFHLHELQFVCTYKHKNGNATEEYLMSNYSKFAACNCTFPTEYSYNFYFNLSKPC